MDLMSDVREHFSLAQYVRVFSVDGTTSLLRCSPERENPTESVAPIEYGSLRLSHLDQVHDLLRRTFWEGISGQRFRTLIVRGY